MSSHSIAPESSAARVALWRAMHVQVDAKPHVITDEVGLKLIAPDSQWRTRGDMHPEGTKIFRASIVARARFIEDLVIDQTRHGVSQYVILGAGLDTFAQRHPDVASKIQIFEVDQPGPQAWKQQRLIELGFGISPGLKFVPVDFEAGMSWWNELIKKGFNPQKPSLIVSTGVSVYLTKEANLATLRQVSVLAPGSTFAMTYLLPMELADPEERTGREMAEKGAKASGTPFISYFAPKEMISLARDAGFRDATTVPASELAQRYFAGRTDGLRPTKSEEILLATT